MRHSCVSLAACLVRRHMARCLLHRRPTRTVADGPLGSVSVSGLGRDPPRAGVVLWAGLCDTAAAERAE
eukprot:3514899-Rhodomonas_salina.5